MPEIKRPYDLIRYGGHKGLAPLCELRGELLERAAGDIEFQHEQWMACKRDILYWLNAYAWTYDPRIVDNPIVPFNTFVSYQDDAFDRMSAVIGKTDLGFHKSRAMGLSWMIIAAFVHRTQFYGDQTFLVVSRNQDLVDKRGDKDALFWKAQFLLENQPAWLRPKLDRKELHIRNMDNGSTIDGTSTTGNVGRGGRRTAVLIDEFAAFPVDDGYRALSATQAVTNSRFVNSTPQGEANAYAEVIVQSGDWEVMEFHWQRHPDYSKGLYTSQNGLLSVLDEKHPPPPDYPFILDGKMRSPWYDNECRRAGGVAWLIAQELDMDFLGSTHQVFNKETIDALLSVDGGTVMPAFAEGRINFTADNVADIVFEERDGGPLRLWTQLLNDKPNPDRNYLIGCDIARGSKDNAGRGASNSVASVVDSLTGEKVAEYAVSGVMPHDFARTVVALCRWFKGSRGDAFLIWEDNGPGQTFRETVIGELCFDNVYMRTAEDTLRKKTTDKPGWWTNQDNKRLLLNYYQQMLEQRKFINRSSLALEECRRYIVQPNGAYEHSKALSEQDPTNARANHGDRVIADALAAWVLKTHRDENATPDIEHPTNCIFARREARDKVRKEEALVW